MKINDFKEEIYKCSGCGICQSACPVYKILKQECAVSRGKFKLLNAIINKDAKFSNKTLQIMDLCLHCQACSEFCPSGIDAQKIIETAQYDMLNCGICNCFKLFSIKLLTNKFCMKIIKFVINFLRKHNITNVLSKLKFNKIKLLNELLTIKIQPQMENIPKEKTLKVLYFKGCINNYINTSTENAVKKVLNNTCVEIVEKDFECCGLPLKSSGDFEGFKKIIKKNLNLISDEVDYILFDCSSCKSTFLTYPDFLTGEYKDKALKIKDKCISIYELLDKINFVPDIKADEKVTFHFPCHTRGTNEKEIIKKLLNNLNYIEMQDADTCCGAAGSYILTNNKISKQISKNKAKNIINTNADIVLTSCPMCVIGLKQGLLETKSDIKIMQLIEYLAEKS